ncbi:MAG: methyltransferase domain-containing protein [Firmicutes bacterium]|jgi:tRNA (guanine6-N2)-methyltransferase|nr:methyltransferase domain-containing protein [Bacillota bacterium]
MATVPTYMATIVPGLEDVAISEITSKLPGSWIQAKLRGRILFATDSSWEKLMQLRSVDNIYFHIAWLKIGSHKADLADLTSSIEDLELPDLPHQTKPKPRARAIVNASRSGNHTFSRFDAAKAALEGLTAAHGFVPATTEAHDYEFRLDIIDGDALFSLKLTGACFRFRGHRTFSKAALRPPIAHALVWLSEPKANDVFLDPFCGSGTIPIERAAYPASSIIGGDISLEAVDAARRNAPENVHIRHMDACELEGIAPQSVSAIVTNLPWGKQIAPNEDIEALYSKFLLATRRVLKADGRAIMLTDQEEALGQACRRAQLVCQPLHKISLHGSLAVIYRIRPHDSSGVAD